MQKRTWVQDGDDWTPHITEDSPPAGLNEVADKVQELYELSLSLYIKVKVGDSYLDPSTCVYVRKEQY